MTPPSRATTSAWRALPLLLLGAMLVIASGVELALHHAPLWLPKLPLVLLLVLPFVLPSLRPRGGRS